MCARRRKWRLIEVFKSLDTARTGRLDGKQLQDLARRVLPLQPTPAQLRYFDAMLDPEGTADLTREELQEQVAACRAIGGQVRDPNNAAAAGVLRDAAGLLQQRSLELRKLFREADAERTGALPMANMVRRRLFHETFMLCYAARFVCVTGSLLPLYDVHSVYARC